MFGKISEWMRSKSSGPHSYDVSTPVSWVKEDETDEQAMKRTHDSLRRHAAPGGHGKEVSSEGTEIDVTGLGKVTSTAREEDYSVTNKTKPDHLLHEGTVNRKVRVGSNKQVYIDSHGEGVGLFPTMNSLFAKPLWSSVDQHIQDELHPELAEQRQRRMEKMMEDNQ